MSFVADVSTLEAAIPQIVAFGRRTMLEQCVTSAAFIAIEAQRNTPHATVGQIDADLQVEVRGYTAKGKPSRAKRPARKVVSALPGVRVPMAVLIVMARTNPNSAYSRSTGNRWPLPLAALPTGPGTARARQAIIAGWVQRMTMARHSSTHFLQHGWGPGIRRLLGHPDYYGGRSRIAQLAQGRINPLNTMNHDPLGTAVVELTGDQCRVIVENDVGDEGNAVLAKKHRDALIAEGQQPLENAIAREVTTMQSKIQDYFDRGLQQRFPNL